MDIQASKYTYVYIYLYMYKEYTEIYMEVSVLWG